MAATGVALNVFKTGLLNGAGFNLVTDTIKCILLNSSFTPNIDATSLVFSDISAYEITGTGYTAGLTNGKALANKVVTQDNVNDRGVLDADDPNWTTSTLTARYMALGMTQLATRL